MRDGLVGIGGLSTKGTNDMKGLVVSESGFRDYGMRARRPRSQDMGLLTPYRSTGRAAGSTSALVMAVMGIPKG